MDKQVIEIAGRSILTVLLMNSGFEVACPVRDRGIDLVVYSELSGTQFKAKPLQLKVASKASFKIDRKYERIKDLLIAYVWNVSGSDKARIFILTYKEAVDVAKQMGYVAKKSWIEKGQYVSNKPGKELQEKLKHYEVTQSNLKKRLSL